MPASEEVPQEGPLGATADIYIRDDGGGAHLRYPIDMQITMERTVDQ